MDETELEYLVSRNYRVDGETYKVVLSFPKADPLASPTVSSSCEEWEKLPTKQSGRIRRAARHGLLTSLEMDEKLTKEQMALLRRC